MKLAFSGGNEATVSSQVRSHDLPHLRLQGYTFHAQDRIVAKRVVVSSEEEQPVMVTSLNWIKKSATVAHLVVSFLYHHVEYVDADFPQLITHPHSFIRIIDGETKNVLTHVAIHTPVYIIL